MTPTSEIIESKPNTDNNAIQDLETLLLTLEERERKFVFNYHTAKSKTELLRICGYSTSNPTTIIRQLLGRAKIVEAMRLYDEKLKKELEQRSKLNAVNKESIILRQDRLAKEAPKDSDKIAADALLCKILGITKESVTVNQGVFNQFMPTQRTNNITYEQVNDTTTDKSST